MGLDCRYRNDAFITAGGESLEHQWRWKGHCWIPSLRAIRRNALDEWHREKDPRSTFGILSRDDGLDTDNSACCFARRPRDRWRGHQSQRTSRGMDRDSATMKYVERRQRQPISMVDSDGNHRTAAVPETSLQRAASFHVPRSADPTPSFEIVERMRGELTAAGLKVVPVRRRPRSPGRGHLRLEPAPCAPMIRRLRHGS